MPSRWLFNGPSAILGRSRFLLLIPAGKPLGFVDDVRVQPHHAQQADGVAGARRAGIKPVIEQDFAVFQPFPEVKACVFFAQDARQFQIVRGRGAQAILPVQPAQHRRGGRQTLGRVGAAQNLVHKACARPRRTASRIRRRLLISVTK